MKYMIFCFLLTMLTLTSKAQIDSIVPPPSKIDFAKESSTSSQTFIIVEELPRFPGCEDIEGSKGEKKQCSHGKLVNYISQNLHYPETARQANAEGHVYVSFIVEVDGSISKIEIVKDQTKNEDLRKEALRIVNSMNAMKEPWISGVQRGKKVRVKMILPVKFDLK